MSAIRLHDFTKHDLVYKGCTVWFNKISKTYCATKTNGDFIKGADAEKLEDLLALIDSAVQQ